MHAMGFALRQYFRLLWLSLFGRGRIDPGHRRNILFCLLCAAVYPLVEVANAAMMLLDRLFFPGFRRVEIRQPVFVIGNPRSGTTILHRVMAKDEERFFCFRTWEIFAPAILQKKVLAGIARLDRLLGGLGERMVRRWEAKKFAEFNRMHQIGLFLPEEDDKLLLHILASADLAWFFPYGGFDAMARLDEQVPPGDQRRIMDFYLGCARRQAWFHGGRRTLLSKNPLFTGKIENLLRCFPDCRIIYLVRNPLDVVPSTVNVGRAIIKSVTHTEPAADLEERVYETIRYYYTYPLQRLGALPADRLAIVNYDDLVRQPQQVVERLYEQFGWELTLKYRRLLEQEAEKMAKYKSSHQYSLDQSTIERKRIVADLQPIFDRFGFDTHDAQLAEGRVHG